MRTRFRPRRAPSWRRASAARPLPVPAPRPPTDRRPDTDPTDEWPESGLRRRARWDPRAGRALTAIQLYEDELRVLEARSSCDGQRACPSGGTATSSAPAGPGVSSESRLSGAGSAGRLQVAGEHLAKARRALADGRVDDAWDFLHTSQRHALFAQTPGELRLTALGLARECSQKLEGHRRSTALASLRLSGLLPDPAGPSRPTGRRPAASTPGRDALPVDPALPYEAVAAAKKVLDGHSHNVYLRARLLARRLAVASALLGLVLVGLGVVVATASPDLAAPAAEQDAVEQVVVLTSGTAYLTASLLGALGALLSLSLGSLRTGTRARVHELAGGSIALMAARMLVGCASAVVVLAAAQTELIGAPAGAEPLLAVAAGFSERLVGRLVDSAGSGGGDRSTA